MTATTIVHDLEQRLAELNGTCERTTGLAEYPHFHAERRTVLDRLRPHRALTRWERPCAGEALATIDAEVEPVDYDYFAGRVDALEARLAGVAEVLFGHVQHCQRERAGLACPSLLRLELASEAAPIHE